MGNLHIALQDGFKNDAVTITVNDNEIFRKRGVTTNLAISLADQVDAPVEGNTARIRVEIETKQKSGTAVVQVNATPYVAVSLGEDGSVTFQPSKEMFRYM